jgi:hypothetical protein
VDRRESELSNANSSEPGDTSSPRRNVVPLGVDPPREEERTPPRPAGLHGVAVLGMAVFALLGIAAMLAFITISWPDDTSRYVVIVFAASVVGFMSCAFIAVFSAARNTYPRQTKDSARE